MGTSSGEHLAFSMSPADFETVFRKVKECPIPYADVFDGVGNMRALGVALGARGAWKALYFFDPSRHLTELADYERSGTA